MLLLNCITAVLKTTSKRSYTYAQSKTAQSLQLPAFPCFHPPKVRFILDPSLNAMPHAATHTHTLALKIRNWKGGNSWGVSHRTQWMCCQKTQNSLFQMERICNDHLVLLPPPHFRADQKLKHVKCISQMPLKHCQAWGTDHPSQQPVPVLDCQTGLKLIWNYSSRECHETTKLTKRIMAHKKQFVPSPLLLLN